MFTILGALVIAVLGAAIFFLLIQRKAGNWAFLLLGALPLLFIYSWSADNRISSSHGLWHASIVYQIMNGSLPPNNPLLGGEPLFYPWAHHAVVAGISQVLRLSPSYVFALMNLGLLLFTILLVYRASRAVCPDRVTNLFAVFLSIYGLTFLARGPIAHLLRELIPLAKLYPGVPIFLKFGQVNSTPLGILFFALYLHSMLRVFSESSPATRHYVLLAISAAGAGLFYPYYWLILLCCCVASCAALFAASGPQHSRRPILVLSSTFAGSLVALPYLVEIINLQAETRSLSFASLDHVVVYGYTLLLTVLPIAVLAVWKHRSLMLSVKSKRDPVLVLISSCATPAAMFILLEGPHGSEYKFAMASLFSLGILASPCMKDLFNDNRRACLIVAVAFLLPFGSYMMRKTNTRNFDHTFIVEDGVHLRHADPDRDALYQWIRTHTAPKAIFVDQNLASIAFFGQRQIYYGEVSESGRRQGWYVPFWMLGYSNAKTETRRKIVEKIYEETNAPLDEEVVAALEATLGDGEVYIVSRSAASRARLSDDRRLEGVFERGQIAVYEVVGRRRPSGE